MHQNGATLPSPQEKCRRSGRVPGKPILPRPPLPALPPRGCGVGSRAGAAGRCSSRSRGCACPEHQVMGRNYRAHRPPPATQCPPSRARPRGGRCRGSRGGGTCRGGFGGNGTAKAARCRPQWGEPVPPPTPFVCGCFSAPRFEKCDIDPSGESSLLRSLPAAGGWGDSGRAAEWSPLDCNRSPVGLQRGHPWGCRRVTCGFAMDHAGLCNG